MTNDEKRAAIRRLRVAFDNVMQAISSLCSMTDYLPCDPSEIDVRSELVRSATELERQIRALGGA